MKKQVFYIHGGDAYSKYEDYFAALHTLPLTLPGEVSSVRWTKALPEVLGEDYEVFMPTMPAKYNAQYEEWALWFSRYYPYLRDDIILIGWSLGGMFLAKYLAENDFPFKIKRLFLLAAPCGACFSEGGNDCGSFQFGPEALQKLNNKNYPIEIWHSKDDFVVSFSAAEAYIQALPYARSRFFDNKNHFLVSELPELIDEIRNQ